MNARFIATDDGKAVVADAAPVRRVLAPVPTAGPLTFEVGDWIAQKPGIQSPALPGEVVQVVMLDGFLDSILHVREGGNGLPYTVKASQVFKITPPGER